jgi:hypothetical protein
VKKTKVFEDMKENKIPFKKTKFVCPNNKFETKRKFINFKIYDEESIFRPEMKRIEMMFRASLDQNLEQKT